MWTALGNGIFLATHDGPEIATITENSTPLSKAHTLDTITPGQFYQDRQNKLLYLSPTGGLSPDINQKTYISHTWQGFCNHQDPNNPVIYPIQGLNPDYYIPALDQASVPPLTQKIGNIFEDKIVYTFGTAAIKDAGWAYKNRRHIFKNGAIIIKTGKKGDQYQDLQTIFTGLMDTPGLTDAGMTIPINDTRHGIFSTLPVKSFLKGEYPYLHPGIHYKPLPILLGQKKNIKPYPINTKTRTYLVSQTLFTTRPQPFPLEAITEVRKDGQPLQEGTDYTLDLDAGTFTLTASPGESQITCDAKGLQIGYDFLTGIYTGNYTDNIANILYFLLIIQQIKSSMIDMESFNQLKKFTRPCGDYITTGTPFSDYLPILQTTGLFHLDISAAGRLTVIPYSRSTPPAVYLDEKNYQNPRTPPAKTNETALSRVYIRYNREPRGFVETEMETEETVGDLASYKYIRAEKLETTYKYGQKSKNYKTILLEESDALDIGNLLLEMMKTPPQYFDFHINFQGLSLFLMQKIGITRTVHTEQHGEIAIYNKAPFIITEIQKNSGTGKCRVTARRDTTQIQGYTLTTYHGRPLATHTGKCLTTGGNQ